jgi:hypothetical protein
MTGHIRTEHFTPKPDRIPSLEIVDEGSGFFVYFDRNADMQLAFEIVHAHVSTLSYEQRGTVRYAVFPKDPDYGDQLARGIVAAKLNPPLRPKRVKLSSIVPGLKGQLT